MASSPKQAKRLNPEVLDVINYAFSKLVREGDYSVITVEVKDGRAKWLKITASIDLDPHPPKAA